MVINDSRQSKGCNSPAADVKLNMVEKVAQLLSCMRASYWGLNVLTKPCHNFWELPAVRRLLEPASCTLRTR